MLIYLALVFWEALKPLAFALVLALTQVLDLILALAPVLGLALALEPVLALAFVLLQRLMQVLP